MALAPRPPAVAKPKLAAKGKAAPKGEAVIPAGKAKGLAKAKALGDNAVAPVLPVACGLLSGGPVLPPPVGPAADVLPHLLVPKFAKLAPVPNVAPPIAKGIPPGLALPAFTNCSILSVSHLLSVEGLHHLKKWVQVFNPWLLCPIPLLNVLETLLDGFMGLLDLMSCIA